MSVVVDCVVYEAVSVDSVSYGTVLVETIGVAEAGPMAPRNLFVQPDAPEGISGRYLWFDTDAPTLWYEDGT